MNDGQHFWPTLINEYGILKSLLNQVQREISIVAKNVKQNRFMTTYLLYPYTLITRAIDFISPFQHVIWIIESLWVMSV